MLVRAAIIGLVLTAGLRAQDPQCDIELQKQGKSWLATVTSHQTSARELLARIARQIGVGFEVDGGVLDIIDGAQPDVMVRRMLVQDLVHHLAGSLDLEGIFVDGVIRVKPMPASDDDAREWLRGHALRAWRQVATSGHKSDNAEALLETALLHLGGEAWAEAVAAFRVFVSQHSRHEKTAWARLLGGWAAFRQGNYPGAAQMLRELENRHESSAEVKRSQLLLGRVYIRMRQYADALLRLDRLVHGDRGRLRALAMLQRAELHFVARDGEAALKALDEFDVDMQREFRDLAAHVPFYTGVCLVLADRNKEAVPHLQSAALQEEDNDFRVRAALALVRIYQKEGDMVTALLASRVARGMKPGGRRLLEALTLYAEILDELGLPELAIPVYEDVIGRYDQPGPGVVRVVEGLAAVLFRDRRFNEARDMFQKLSMRPALAGVSLLMMAQCDVSMGEYERALEVLSRAAAADPPAKRTELARLQGLCHIRLGQFEMASRAYEGGKEKR